MSMSEKSQVKSTESNDQLMEECASRDSEGGSRWWREVHALHNEEVVVVIALE